MADNNPMAGASDEDLLAAVARGEVTAFSTFYDRHAGLLYLIAWRVLGDETEAQDALQEALVLIWERAPAFDPRLGRPLSWAAALARNKAVDRLRTRARRARVLTDAAAQGPERESFAESPAESRLAAETAETVGTALARLPEDQRVAIELAFFGGLSQTEIAERLGAPLGTIKARIRRGMEQLRTLLRHRERV